MIGKLLGMGGGDLQASILCVSASPTPITRDLTILGNTWPIEMLESHTRAIK